MMCKKVAKKLGSTLQSVNKSDNAKKHCPICLSIFASLKRAYKALDSALNAAYYTKYKSAALKEYLEMEDFFMILTFGKLYGLDNPYEYEMLPMLPYLMERYHAWHTRVGANAELFEHFPCAGCC